VAKAKKSTTKKQAAPAAAPAGGPPVLDVLQAFTKLGLTSFGGPVAHIGYFRSEFVDRRKWLDDRAFADLVALCNFLPGPASSQTGIALGLMRAGYAGALAAWIGFTLPSAIALVLFAYGVSAFGNVADAGWLQGLKVAAVAVVAQAVLSMMQSLAPDRERATLAVIAAAIVLAIPTALGQLAAIVLGGIVGVTLLRDGAAAPNGILPVSVSRPVAIGALVLFFALLVALPLLSAASGNQAFAYFDAFYRAGSLVFGGGHVVLPLLQAEVVPPGWVSEDAFLAGYGAAQAVPGPLFTFAAYLGAVMGPAPNGWSGAALCLVAIFLPSFLLVTGALPFWQGLRTRPDAQAALRGVNAAVVGILLAALYDPVWTAGIKSGSDFALGAAAFLLLYLWRTPPWLVVILCAIVGGLVGFLPPAA
jgi:chromate transporter